MTPEEKAKELIDKYYPLTSGCHPNVHVSTATAHKMKFRKAKDCALITVNEVLCCTIPDDFESIKYWQEVKEELNKMI